MKETQRVRFRLPDRIKERQADALKKRFAAYSRQSWQNSQNRKGRFGKYAALALLALLIWWTRKA